MIRSISTLCAASLFLAGCSTPQGDFPSLAKRPFESQNIAPEAQLPVVQAAALPPAIAAKVNALMGRHAKAQAAFSAALPAMRALAKGAAGSAVGSEAWVNAEQQLSRLDKSRSDSLALQGELDQLVMAQTDLDAQNNAPSLSELLSPYQSEVSDDVAGQSAEIERMTALLGV